jgi:hypothetical protein
MKSKYKLAYQALKVMGVPVFTNADNDKLGNFCISGEHPDSPKWADYYDAPDHFIFGVNPAIESLLAQFDLMCEWINPGCLGVYEA